MTTTDCYFIPTDEDSSFKEGMIIPCQFVYCLEGLNEYIKFSRQYYHTTALCYSVECLSQIEPGEEFCRKLKPDFTLPSNNAYKLTKYYFCAVIKLTKTFTIGDLTQKNKASIRNPFSKSEKIKKDLQQKAPVEKLIKDLTKIVETNQFLWLSSFEDGYTKDDIADYEKLYCFIIKTVKNKIDSSDAHRMTRKLLTFASEIYHTTGKENILSDQTIAVLSTQYLRPIILEYDLPFSICCQLLGLNCNHQKCVILKHKHNEINYRDIRRHTVLRKILYHNSLIVEDIDDRLLTLEELSWIDPLLLEYAALDLSDFSSFQFSIVETKEYFEYKNIEIDFKTDVIIQRVHVKGKLKQKPQVTTKMVCLWYFEANPDTIIFYGKKYTNLFEILVGLYRYPHWTIPYIDCKWFAKFPALFELIRQTKPLKYCLNKVISILPCEAHLPCNIYGLQPTEVIEGIREKYYLHGNIHKTNKIPRDPPVYIQDIIGGYYHNEQNWAGPDALAKGAPDYTDEILAIRDFDTYTVSQIKKNQEILNNWQCQSKTKTDQNQKINEMEKLFDEYLLINARSENLLRAPLVCFSENQDHMTRIHKFLINEKKPPFSEVIKKYIPQLNDNQISNMIELLFNNLIVYGPRNYSEINRFMEDCWYEFAIYMLEMVIALLMEGKINMDFLNQEVYIVTKDFYPTELQQRINSGYQI